MARLNNEVDAIDAIRSDRERKAKDRKRRITLATIGGSALFSIGILVGALNTGRISVSVISDSASVQQLAAVPVMADKPKFAAVEDKWTSSDAERLSVVVGRPSENSLQSNSAPIGNPAVVDQLRQSLPPAMPPANLQAPAFRVPLPPPSIPQMPRLVVPSKQPPIPPPQSAKPREDVSEKEASAIDVDLPAIRTGTVVDAARPSAQAGLSASPPVTAPAQGFRIVQYMDTYVLIRVGNKVSTVKVGERLPDGRLLKAVADGSITTE
jgi:hypothetical protein